MTDTRTDWDRCNGHGVVTVDGGGTVPCPDCQPAATRDRETRVGIARNGGKWHRMTLGSSVAWCGVRIAYSEQPDASGPEVTCSRCLTSTMNGWAS